ncbi:EF hand domain-containing protein [Limimaricola soesokkakensis]|uniref:EF hand n=1 Tax=Limimaricola soesokkakensis TaxID=1343159 RepID=A0A1X6ZAE5_9RHOB|nr:hypothetical protein [Limimaricola soesokkakensis]PSK86425.1 EF hand domain-containing protein [Limimaricola soesokkakensis]SLN46094.1 EF hand [Limimaricola soesokkakensis]
MKIAGKISAIAVMATLSGIIAGAASAQQHPEMKPLPRAEALKLAGARFDAADTNRDGRVSAEEARAARPEARPGKGEGRGHGPRQGLDQNRGQEQRPAAEARAEFKPLSRAETLSQEAARFDAADKNGDGVLSVEEMRASQPPRR